MIIGPRYYPQPAGPDSSYKSRGFTLESPHPAARAVNFGSPIQAAPCTRSLHGLVATMGRDPSCDLVLNDPKCSREHAVVEVPLRTASSSATTGAANGITRQRPKAERARPQDRRRRQARRRGHHGAARARPGTLVDGRVQPRTDVGRPAAEPRRPCRRSRACRPASDRPRRARPPAPRAQTSVPPVARAQTVPSGPAWKAPARPLTVAVLAVLWVPQHSLPHPHRLRLAQSVPAAGGWSWPALLVVARGRRGGDGRRALERGGLGVRRRRSRSPRSGS